MLDSLTATPGAVGFSDHPRLATKLTEVHVLCGGSSTTDLWILQLGASDETESPAPAKASLRKEGGFFPRC